MSYSERFPTWISNRKPIFVPLKSPVFTIPKSFQKGILSVFHRQLIIFHRLLRHHINGISYLLYSLQGILPVMSSKKNPIRYTSQERAKIILLYRQGVKVGEIASSFNRSKGSLHRILKSAIENGEVKPRRPLKKWSECEIKTLTKMRGEGSSWGEISKVLGRNYYSVAMKFHNLTLEQKEKHSENYSHETQDDFKSLCKALNEIRKKARDF